MNARARSISTGVTRGVNGDGRRIAVTAQGH
jgi:hypothetical protein